ncbi:hypothetical protein M6D93_19015 [Jatrophihabitans telluris]|uniref:GNAT family N-acetyltransferase n=1 Tax=Jatrophihabitans telluris TaxID=2038343 RepID=A0ABY4QZI7_9ACTN|nr:hypothetical protein [Jatrophihabitans telluris]UQX88350.1 hypothetical protein M6D93_19015 [Jatrophihabitans telluris]
MPVDYTLHFDARGDVKSAAEQCEAEVFLQAYGNTTEELAEEYGPYEATSSFIAVTDTDGDAVACIRLITPSPLGLKTVNDLSRPPWNVNGRQAGRAAGLTLDNFWDVATFGVRKGAAGGMLLSAALCHALVRGWTVNEVDGIVMIMDERARRVFGAIGLQCHRFPGAPPGPYLGSPISTPLWGFSEQLVRTQRRVNPEAHRLISLGVGLDGISLPDTEGFRMKPRVPAAIVVEESERLSA